MNKYRIRYIKDGKIQTKEFNMSTMTEQEAEKIQKEIQKGYESEEFK
tara:strand:- start:980 stop:1120 length:141 start_codon:yes stop_codon:yes gene_type:complete